MLAGLGPAARAGDGPDLLDMSLNELMNVNVTAVTKSAKPLADTPAAMTVISQEDIRRSGATNVPDLLRLAPGMQVAQVNGNEWAISARGFSDVYSNKLLVMIDGRSIYNPVFTGVHWDQVGLMLEEIQRIEIVRGPGATMWGSNAVNGIIHIITKSAADQQGGLITGGGGNLETGFGGVRYNGRLGDNAFYRLYAKHSSRDNFYSLDAPDRPGASPGFSGRRDNHDRLVHDRGGFRIDWEKDNDSLNFSGDFFQGKSDWRSNLAAWPLDFDTLSNTVDISGENLMGKWKRNAGDWHLETHAYWDHYKRINSFYREEVQTLDIDGQAAYQGFDSHEITVGGGYRYITDDLTHDPSGTVSFDPGKRDISIYNLFVQDDYALLPDTLNFIYGAKYEYNGFAGSQAQPSGRLLWKLSDRHRFWGAVSHAVRTPSRTDQDIRFNYLRLSNLRPNQFCPGGTLTPCQYSLAGNPGFGSEKLNAFEIGYRFNPAEDFSLDIAGFYNRYFDLATRDDVGFSRSAGQAWVQRSKVPHNRGRAETIGLEMAAHWQVDNRWRLHVNYTYINLSMHRGAASNDANADSFVEDTEAQQQASLRSLFNLTDSIELDGTLFYVDQRPYQAATLPGLKVREYLRLDARLAWMPKPGLEFEVVGQNLLDGRHLEYVQEFSPLPAEIPRSVFGRVRVYF